MIVCVINGDEVVNVILPHACATASSVAEGFETNNVCSPLRC